MEEEFADVLSDGITELRASGGLLSDLSVLLIPGFVVSGACGADVVLVVVLVPGFSGGLVVV